ncbi:MAG: hypothetical protein IT439_02680 [Phycisphaerales bacterium]|nr:hypothetical protein [Phycisphaerales bacterium]
MAEIEIGEGGSGEGAPDGAGPAPDPKINELTTWRKRALDAEAKARASEEESERQRARADEALRARVGAEDALEAARALHQAGVRDLDEGLARVRSLREAAPEKSVREIVGDLRRNDPGLFAVRQGVNSAGAQGPRDPLADLADEARASGDRRALLRYLRARRGG